MTSIHTNTIAMNTIATLRGIDLSLSGTQDRVSSGLRIRTAQDNASYWSIATTLRGDMASRSAAADAINLSLGLVDTAYSGVTQSIDIMNEMKNKFLIAVEASDETKVKLEGEIIQLRNAFTTVVKSSSFAGDNWLYKTATTQSNSRSLVTGVTRLSDGSVSVQKTTVDLTSIFLLDFSISNSPLGILSRSYSSTSGFSAFAYSRHASVKAGSGAVTAIATAGANAAGTRNALIASARIIDLIVGDLVTAAATLGSLRSGLDLQQAYSQQLEGVDKRSLGRLVDADMNEESARVRALQTRQQIAYQGLNIANGNSSHLLQLFR